MYISVEELNENYFTLKEIAVTYKKNYANLSRKVDKLKLTDYNDFYSLGNRFIVYKDDIPALIHDGRDGNSRKRVHQVS